MRTVISDDHSLLDAVLMVRAFCWACMVVIVIARLIPASQKRFLSYGARGQPASSISKQISHPTRSAHAWLDWLASVDVPHSWFTHFYVLSLFSSLFWVTQVASKNGLLQAIGEYVPMKRLPASQPEVLLGMLLMIFQSTRRLWESYQFSRGSKSRMWIGHYFFGLAFYFFVNIATWIEHVHAFLHQSNTNHGSWRATLGKGHVLLGLCMFFMASSVQYLAHAHLAGLPKYSIPHHWLFDRLIAPHYTAECVIYIGLSIVAAPKQQTFNGTLLCMVLLTTINLGITAHDTKDWMLSKFREEEVRIRSKYCMVPGVW